MTIQRRCFSQCPEQPVSDRDITPDQETGAKRRSASFWGLNGVGALFCYLFGYPAAVAMLFKALTPEQAEWVEGAWFAIPLMLIAAPITWLAERIPLYQDYLNWLGEAAGLV